MLWRVSLACIGSKNFIRRVSPRRWLNFLLMLSSHLEKTERDGMQKLACKFVVFGNSQATPLVRSNIRSSSLTAFFSYFCAFFSPPVCITKNGGGGGILSL